MRGNGDVLMGKNTMMKKAIKECLETNPALERLVPLIKQNVGFVLTNGDLKETRDLIETFKVPAAARAGAISPVDVVVPAQATTLGPEKTSFFQVSFTEFVTIVFNFLLLRRFQFQQKSPVV